MNTIIHVVPADQVTQISRFGCDVSGYLSGYKPKSVTEQTNILHHFFPSVGFADEKVAEKELPEYAEGWFVIPKWQTVAPTYGEAVRNILDRIKETRNGAFWNCREGQIDSGRFRQSARTVDMLQKIGNKQKDYDIIVVPAQFGIQYRDLSVDQARELFTKNEFGLDAFIVGIMLLTHPERLQQYDDLWIDCAGNDFAPNVADDFSGAPHFRFVSDKVWFSTSDTVDATIGYGSASGFLL